MSLSKIRTILCTALIVLLSACGSVSNTTEQATSTAYVKIVGVLEGVSVQIDNGQRKSISELFDDIDDGLVRLQLGAGNYQIKLYKNDQLVVNRKVFLATSEHVEIRIP